MDAFVKHRRNRNRVEKKKVEWTNNSSSSSSAAVVVAVNGEPDTKPQAARQQAWPLYLPTGLLSTIPTGISNGGSAHSCASSGSLPSTSTCEDNRRSNCSSPLSYSDDSISSDDLENTIKRVEQQAARVRELCSIPLHLRPPEEHLSFAKLTATNSYPVGQRSSPLLLLGSDTLAQVLTFLEPAEVLSTLTMPLCKAWYTTCTSQQEIWRVLCLLEPFKAKVGDNNSDDDSDLSDDDSFCAMRFDPMADGVFGKYRLMYTSFVRCTKYLCRIKEDALSGREPSVVDYGHSGFPRFGVSQNLKKFLSRKGSILKDSRVTVDTEANVPLAPIGVSDDGYSSDESNHKRSAEVETQPPAAKKPKLAARSSITDRLLGPTADGKPSHLSLPKSCAIYSLVNWMVGYPDVEGIQTMCVKTLPYLLEDENQRMIAQRVGMVEVVVRSMLQFPDSLKLHIAAFHTMVLLARPLGGREGMLFDNSMAESSSTVGLIRSQTPPGVASSSASSASAKLNGINGIAVMMDSMKRFESEAELQAMACWAMVNLALVPAQKVMLISLDCIQRTIDAMLQHPHSHDVQFRALFALINLVPCKNPKALTYFGAGSSTPSVMMTEKDILDKSVDQVVHLVVNAMKNFHESKNILNRACLVLHNLSQNEDYLHTLLWTPHLYQMLEWAIANFQTDHVLRRSAVSTLHRLQLLLSGNGQLQRRFRDFLANGDTRAARKSNTV